ncbi:hypothetical protein [Aliagarivorans taiwanensis]|uniref:hypothetical protein n=1 Tax=Aliagarivorans taiwanensis TaxID=561966 RepID=UPI0003FB9DB2|nr:hypothetical protein [Aliagarivorans taiwanensis]
MPHCIIECPTTLSRHIGFQLLVNTIHDSLVASDLFHHDKINTRAYISEHFKVAGSRQEYLHLDLCCEELLEHQQMQGVAQQLSHSIYELLPKLPNLSIRIHLPQQSDFVQHFSGPQVVALSEQRDTRQAI